jgi:hypothetical protein
MRTAVQQEILKEKDHLDGPRSRWEKNIILTLMLNTIKGVNWIYLAEGWDKWCALFEHGNELPASAKCKGFRD